MWSLYEVSIEKPLLTHKGLKGHHVASATTFVENSKEEDV